MSHSQTPAAKTMAAVERARQDVNGLKQHVKQLMRSDAPIDQNIAHSLAKHTQKAEALVEKAENTVKRIKNVSRVPPRPTASVPPAQRAKRALSVLLPGIESDDVLLARANPKDPKDRKPATEKPSDAKESDAKRRRLFLSSAGKPTATPLRSDALTATFGKVHKETGLAVLRNPSDGGVIFQCPNVFRAFVWFKDVDAPPGAKPLPDGTSATYVVPEHIAIFGVDETNAGRWACSRYAVFKVITERANTAVRYFMAREDTGEEAFLALGKWLARHKTLFTPKTEERRLAFDASRGIFLPSCIYPFEGQGPPRFSRGSIPLRSNSSYAGQPTVRVPQSSQAVQNTQASAAAAAGAASTGKVAASGASAPAPSSGDAAATAGRTAASMQPGSMPTGSARMNPVDLRALANRSRA